MKTSDTTQTAGKIPVIDQSPKQPKRSTKNSTWWKRGGNLVQHVPTGTFYARVKIGGKTLRASLGTDVFTTARLRLPDKVTELRKPEVTVGSFGQHAETFRSKTNHDALLSPAGKAYRLRCVDRLLKSWPELEHKPANKITADECEKWWNTFCKKYSAQFVNHTLVYMRLILRKIARIAADPTFELKPVGIKQKELLLPSTDQFNRIVEITLNNGTPEAQDSADMIRLLAYTGCRISEAQALRWRDVNFAVGEVRITCAKRRRTSRESDYRLLPMNASLRELLQSMHARRKPQPDDRVCVLDGVRRSLARASRLIKIPELTHHSLRHFFASVCIESQVDIQTLSRWLGHSDGGSLCQRVYGHLRKEHSEKMAAKISFGAAPLPANVTLLPKDTAIPAANVSV